MLCFLPSVVTGGIELHAASSAAAASVDQIVEEAGGETMLRNVYLPSINYKPKPPGPPMPSRPSQLSPPQQSTYGMSASSTDQSECEFGLDD